MSKHTPGPYKRDGDLLYKLENHVGLGGLVVERNRVAISIRHSSSVSAEEVEANIALHEAAPDLLEACERALDIAKAIEVFHDGAEGTDARRLLEAAIAKARGEK